MKATNAVWMCSRRISQSPEFLIEVDFELVSGKPIYGFRFNDDAWDSGSFYLFAINPELKQYALFFYENADSRTPVIDWKNSDLIDGVCNRLKMIQKEGKVDLYINGTTVDSAEVEVPSEIPRIGFHVYDSTNDNCFTVHCDNYVYERLDN